MLMQQLLDEASATLANILSVLDELSRASLSFPSLTIKVCELKLATQDFIEEEQRLDDRLSGYIQECLLLFPRCDVIYKTLYLKMFHAMDRSRSYQAFQYTAKAASSVPIDPNSSLNVIQCDPVECILYNDNENLMKLPIAPLWEVPFFEQRLAAVEEYYDEEAAKIYNFSERFEQECAQLEEKTQPLIDCLRGVMLSLGDASPLIKPLTNLSIVVERVVECRGKEREHSKTYVENVLAKFMVVVQLRDVMLRSYELTRAHQRNEEIETIF